jgi:hypothetical protein
MAANEHIDPPQRGAWERFVAEAEGRGLTPEQLADERMVLAPTPAMLELNRTFEELADLRDRLRDAPLDPVAIIRAGRRELERRGP